MHPKMILMLQKELARKEKGIILNSQFLLYATLPVISIFADGGRSTKAHTINLFWR